MAKADLKTVQELCEPAIKECPYCGYDEFYYNQHMVGDGYVYCRYDGKETSNYDMHESLRYTVQGKFAYCSNCRKRVFRFRK